MGDRRYRERRNVISCGLPSIHGRKECDQLWVTGNTWKEGMRSVVCNRRNREVLNVISCVLSAIQGRNECDQLCVTDDTGEE